MNISDIKSKYNKVSDKYSCNLYGYLKKFNTVDLMRHRVLWDQTDGKPLHPMNIYMLQGGHGTTLLNIMWKQWNKYWWQPERIKGYIDITEEFWKDYISKGRCIFDVSHSTHWEGDEQRFTIIDDDTKECQWCGAVLRRTVDTVVTEVEHWEVEQ